MYTGGGGRKVLRLSNKQNSTKEFIFSPSHRKINIMTIVSVR